MTLQGGQGRQEEQYKPVFNQDELRVLRECNRESFYFRSVPLATALSAATYMAIRKGLLKPGLRFGYAPKISAAVAVGYFLGKLSYQGACAEKIMQLPNSQLAEVIRKRKGRQGFSETLGMEAGFSLSPQPDQESSSSSAEPIFDDHRPDQRDHNESLDDYHRGVTESLNPYTEAPPDAPHPLTSYQDLRRQNREEYNNKMTEKYRRPMPSDNLHDIPPPPSPPLRSSSSPPPRPLRKNQYGDDVHE